MCNYSEYVYEKGFQIGYKQGIEKAYQEEFQKARRKGEERLAKLLLKLMADSETEMYYNVLLDKTARKECYKKYGIV